MLPALDGQVTICRSIPPVYGYDPYTMWKLPQGWYERRDNFGPRGKPCTEGGYWVNAVGGGFSAKPPDTILAVQTVRSDRELDWRGTDRYDHLEAGVRTERYKTGWIRPDGRFYACAGMAHDQLAYYYLGYEVRELEAMGYCRVVDVGGQLYMNGNDGGPTDAQIETFDRLTREHP